MVSGDLSTSRDVTVHLLRMNREQTLEFRVGKKFNVQDFDDLFAVDGFRDFRSNGGL